MILGVSWSRYRLSATSWSFAPPTNAPLRASGFRWSTRRAGRQIDGARARCFCAALRGRWAGGPPAGGRGTHQRSAYCMARAGCGNGARRTGTPRLHRLRCLPGSHAFTGRTNGCTGNRRRSHKRERPARCRRNRVRRGHRFGPRCPRTRGGDGVAPGDRSGSAARPAGDQGGRARRRPSQELTHARRQTGAMTDPEHAAAHASDAAAELLDSMASLASAVRAARTAGHPVGSIGRELWRGRAGDGGARLESSPQSGSLITAPR